MPVLSRIRIGGIVRLLLIAFWAISAAFAPAHAMIDALEDPCQQTAAASVDHAGVSGDVSGDVDQKFHAAHDCGTCHVHALPAPVAQAMKLAASAEARGFADALTSPSARADGPFRPPRA